MHLCLYCAVGGCFAFGLYVLLQPTRVANPGIGAYKPPPATVIAYGPSSGLPPPPDVTVPQPIATDNLAQTTGRSEPIAPEPTRLDQQPSTHVKKVKRSSKELARREVKVRRELASERERPDRNLGFFAPETNALGHRNASSTWHLGSAFGTPFH
jgi:hypothetical protein